MCEKRFKIASQDSLRAFVNEMKQKTQWVDSSCKETCVLINTVSVKLENLPVAPNQSPPKQQ